MAEKECIESCRYWMEGVLMVMSRYNIGPLQTFQTIENVANKNYIRDIESSRAQSWKHFPYFSIFVFFLKLFVRIDKIFLLTLRLLLGHLVWLGTVSPFIFYQLKKWRTPSTTCWSSSLAAITCSWSSAWWTTALRESSNGRSHSAHPINIS